MGVFNRNQTHQSISERWSLRDDVHYEASCKRDCTTNTRELDLQHGLGFILTATFSMGAWMGFKVRNPSHTSD